MCELTEFQDADAALLQETCCAVCWTMDSTSIHCKTSEDCYQVMVNIELDAGADLSWRNQTKTGGKLRPACQVARRNARERRRVQTVNAAFSRLHDMVPVEFGCGPSGCVNEDNKLKRASKVTTLKRTIDYIKLLQWVLHRPMTNETPQLD